MADSRKAAGRTGRMVLPLALIPLVLVTLSVTGSFGSTRSAASAATADPPNIVVIMTDDQRDGTFETMPAVRHRLMKLGERFTGVVPTSTCCPSRAAFLSGNFAHTTGVYDNVGDTTGGWKAFNASGYESKTIATALNDAGYETGLFGKYLNGWVVTPTDFVPPGWDQFMAIRDSTGNLKMGAGAYYNYHLTGTQPTTWYANNAADYSTDVIFNRSVDFIDSSISGGPYFVVITPYGPHEPFTPAPRDVGAWTPSQPYDNAAVNELDMSDKPAFLQNLSPVSPSYIQQAQTKTGQALMSVDDGVAEVLRAASAESSNTLYIFLSDNGVMWGEHRLLNKYKPYRWATEVPTILRWDGHIAPGTDGGLAANVDLSATILDVAGVPDALTMEGHSLLTTSRSSMVLEALRTVEHPAYCGVRTLKWLYVKYSGTKGRELYNYARDPFELQNLAFKARFRTKRLELQAQAEAECSPVPPGFTW